MREERRTGRVEVWRKEGKRNGKEGQADRKRGWGIGGGIGRERRRRSRLEGWERQLEEHTGS